MQRKHILYPIMEGKKKERGKKGFYKLHARTPIIIHKARNPSKFKYMAVILRSFKSSLLISLLKRARKLVSWLNSTWKYTRIIELLSYLIREKVIKHGDYWYYLGFSEKKNCVWEEIVKILYVKLLTIFPWCFAFVTFSSASIIMLSTSHSVH